ncbi:MAG: hypothetical protein ACRDEA_10955 [Microcystaceae cyanobacterium]
MSEKAMQLLKRMSYIRLKDGWQTYLFGSDFKPLPYKFLATQTELEEAIAQCQQQGWKVTDATDLTNRLNRRL